MTEEEKKEIVDFLENQVKTGENMTGSSYNVWFFKNRLQKALKLIENSVPKEAIREFINEEIAEGNYYEDDIDTDIALASYDKYINSRKLLEILGE